MIRSGVCVVKRRLVTATLTLSPLPNDTCRSTLPSSAPASWGRTRSEVQGTTMYERANETTHGLASNPSFPKWWNVCLKVCQRRVKCQLDSRAKLYRMVKGRC